MSLTKSNRLKKEKDISKVFHQGDIFFSFPLKILSAKREQEVSSFRACVSVGKRYHKNATDRNKIKRRIKESLKKQLLTASLELQNTNLALDLMIVYVSKEIESYAKIDSVISKFIKTLEKDRKNN